ncbi:hypothetical protein WUBG_03756 [Wuchereria bancrofti]|uniref:Uncharacterized protein n=1 Tax=Wuchereria bancrofti TaxID=6293 RepID=J9ET20_WUCBA|nr:hypothetical protein WUBG_03756 [Wuchereria bancrofti]
MANKLMNRGANLQQFGIPDRIPRTRVNLETDNYQSNSCSGFPECTTSRMKVKQSTKITRVKMKMFNEDGSNNDGNDNDDNNDSNNVSKYNNNNNNNTANSAGSVNR